MKLRAVRLENVRRFAGKTVEISDIGDGITVLSAPNEFGKSTIFDALHAVFFEKFSGKSQSIKDLQPHSGGAPNVRVEIETPKGRFWIEKQWLSRPAARVTDCASGRLIASEDEAEAWIAQIVGADLRGPTGLLWVRQGDVWLDPEGATAREKSEREDRRRVRQNLLNSVVGREIDMMTGGRRMDQVLHRVGEKLDLLATKRGKPKAGGAWAVAVDAAAALEEEATGLRIAVSDLRQSLVDRHLAERRLAELDDPDVIAQQAELLVRAEEAHAAAVAHQVRADQARQANQVAELSLCDVQRQLSDFDARTEAAKAAVAAHSDANRELAIAREHMTQHQAAETRATSKRDEADGKAKHLRTALDKARIAATAQAAAERLAALRAQLTSAETARRQLEEAEAALANVRITPESLRAAEQAHADALSARKLAEAQGVRVTLQYEGDARASFEGAEIEPDQPVVLREPSVLKLPGIGKMMLEPPANSDTSIDDAERALRSALQNCAAASIEDARVALQARDDLRARCNRAKDVLANVAPKGIADLQAACAALEADAASAGEPGDIADLTARLRRADAALAECDGALASAVSLARQAQADLARAEAHVASAENAVSAAVLPDGDRDALARGVDTAEAQVRETREAVDSLKAQAPDVGAAEAALQRARSVQDRTEKERNATVKALAELNGEISARASRGVEEALADVAGRAKAAAARAARFEGEVAALTLLRDTLLAARSTARDAYFEPVRRTLMPLLAMVYDQAELVMDDATLLPSGLRRGGQDERLDILSGGTREQIAILTRLAFAALLNEAGQPVPVILDDALVHSDDDRIAAMFNALHRSASAQQIIVLTCRQRAFRDLGGAEAQVRISDQRDVP